MIHKRAFTALAVVAMTLGQMGTAPAVERLARYELPDLRPLEPPQVMGPETGFLPTLGVDAPVVVEGCFLDERVRHGARRCLRFDAIAANSGAGPFEVSYEPDVSTTLAAAYQRVFRSDGTYRDRFATRSEFHPTHAHFHIADFYTARLWKADRHGRRVGPRPVAQGAKSGFCPEDTAHIERSNSARHYECFGESEREEVYPRQVVGISAGWMDVYPYALPDQFVEITGVPDGFYVLELELDPNNVFMESDESNNAVCAALHLVGEQAYRVEPSYQCRPAAAPRP